MSRLLIIGIDSACFDLINPWIAQGLLPNLAGLIRNGVSGKLRSVIPPMSPPAWTSFATGKNPGKHGIFDFTTRRSGTYELEFVNALWRKSDTIWKIMSDAGKRVCTVAVPVSWPPEKINGIMISGIDTPAASGGTANRSGFWPPEIFEEITHAVGNYLISPNIGVFETHRVERILCAAGETVSRKMETALYLYKKEPWDCFTVVVGESDAVSHRLWKYHDKNSPFSDEHSERYRGPDPVLQIYRKIDEYIGKICSLISEDTAVIIMSDHGHGGNLTKAVYPNRWLERQNILQFKTETKRKLLINKFFRQAKKTALKLLPPNLKKTILRKTDLGSRLESAIRFSAIDWSKTRAFFEETPYFPNIWINLKGREPQGIVTTGKAYNDIREYIAERLYRWTDPETGQPLVKKVWKREEIYSGPFVEKAPDLIIDWNTDRGYSYLFRSSQHIKAGQNPVSRITSQEMKQAKSGDHRDDGLFVAAGKTIRKNKEVKGAYLIDLSPTILYLLGLRIPSDMDGRVLTGIFEEEYLSSHSVEYDTDIRKDIDISEPGESYSDEEKNILASRLRELGYME
jgi:predicted AlkP superfamily phosphohydrolase/phosphomutase